MVSDGRFVRTLELRMRDSRRRRLQRSAQTPSFQTRCLQPRGVPLRACVRKVRASVIQSGVHVPCVVNCCLQRHAICAGVRTGVGGWKRVCVRQQWIGSEVTEVECESSGLKGRSIFSRCFCSFFLSLPCPSLPFPCTTYQQCTGQLLRSRPSGVPACLLPFQSKTIRKHTQPGAKHACRVAECSMPRELQKESQQQWKKDLKLKQPMVRVKSHSDES